MKNLLLSAVLVSLPLLLGGCGEKIVNDEELEIRGDITYRKGSDTPYTGKYFRLYKNGKKEAEGNFKDGKEDGLETQWHENGQKMSEYTYKDGKPDGLWVSWHENGQKSWEGNLKNGNIVEGSVKFWNSKGEPVDSKEEALKE